MFPANGFRLRFSGRHDRRFNDHERYDGWSRFTHLGGAGGLGVMDPRSFGPASGAQNALNVTTGFLYLPSCAGGTPSGIPLRCRWRRRYRHRGGHTVAEKIWAYINGAWKFLQLTDPAAAPGAYLPLTGGALTGALSVTTAPSLTSALAVNGRAALVSGNSVAYVAVQGALEPTRPERVSNGNSSVSARL